MRIRAGLFAIATCLLLTGCQPPATPSSLQEDERQTFALQAARTRYQARLNEGGTMPENALMAAKAHRDSMLEQDAGGIFPASWTWIGPGGIGGRIRSIVIDPTNPSIMWVGSVGGGIWKTVDGGTSWSPMDDFLATIAVGCMAIDNTNPDVLYAGTGEGFFEAVMGSSNTATMRGAGVFKSTDEGVTWTQLANTATWTFVNRLATHPTNGNIVWAATDTGVYRSADGGNTWTQKTAGDFLDLKMHPTDPTKLLANKSHVGVFYTNDEGGTWTQATGIAGHRAELTYCPSDPNIVYACQSDNDQLRIYRSTNGGQSFAIQPAGGVGTYAIYNNTIWVDPTNPNNVVIGGVNLYRSTNAGGSLAQTYTGVHSDMHTIVSHPGYNGTTNRTIFVGCDGGIYRITDSTLNGSTRINNNLGITQFYGAAVHDGTGVVVAGAQDNGTNRYTGNPIVWNENVIGGDGAYCASDPTNSSVWYGASQYQAIRRSSNGGASFGTGVAPPGSGSANNYNFIPYFMLDPNNSNRMLACGELLYRSNNIRTGTPPTWTSIKNSIRTGGRPGGGGDNDGSDGDGQAHFQDNNPWNISTCAVAEGNSDIIWVGHNNGSLYKTVNGTTTTPTWTKMDLNPTALPDRWISRIVIDRTNHNRVYVSFLGWASNNVYRTVDGGATWQQLTGAGTFSLPPAPVGAFAMHRTKPGWLYAGTDIGIFTSSDDGATWTTSTDGPGTVPIDELLWRNDNVLMAVTHGRGVFFATINPNEEPFSPRSYTIVRGSRISGSVDEVMLSDDRYLRVRTFPDSFIVVEFAGVAPVPTGGTLRFTLESSVSQAGGALLVDMFNFSLGGWERVSTTSSTLTDSTVTVTAPGTVSNFIEPGTRRVRARAVMTGSNRAARSWSTNVDQAFWKLLP
jgi:hypothetical protein